MAGSFLFVVIVLLQFGVVGQHLGGHLVTPFERLLNPIAVFEVRSETTDCRQFFLVAALSEFVAQPLPLCKRQLPGLRRSAFRRAGGGNRCGTKLLIDLRLRLVDGQLQRCNFFPPMVPPARAPDAVQSSAATAEDLRPPNVPQPRGSVAMVRSSVTFDTQDVTVDRIAGDNSEIDAKA